MATKDYLVSSKEKEVCNGLSNSQYSNFNLNQTTHKCLQVNSLQSKSISPLNKNVENFVHNDNKESKGTKDGFGFRDKSKKALPSQLLKTFNHQDKKEFNNSNPIRSSSTLSLHIAAYENSIESSDDSFGGKGLKNESKSLGKNWKTAKQICADSTLAIQNSFEFPRQQKDDEDKEPEIAQFKASQKLNTFDREDSDDSEILYDSDSSEDFAGTMNSPESNSNSDDNFVEGVHGITDIFGKRVYFTDIFGNRTTFDEVEKFHQANKARLDSMGSSSSKNLSAEDEEKMKTVLQRLGISNEKHEEFKAMKNYTEKITAKYSPMMPGFDDILKAYYYRDGFGCFKQDYRQAFKHYLKAAEYGNSEAMFNLGKMYRLGQGVDNTDYDRAMKWFLKAASSTPFDENDTSIFDAQNAIGEFYMNGFGVEKDYPKAAEWFQKASDGGMDEAKKNLEKLYKVIIFLVEPSLIPPLEKVKRDPQRKALLVKNRENFVDSAKKYATATTKKSSEIEEKLVPYNLDLSNWPSAKKIALKEMFPRKDKVYDGFYMEGRIIDWPFLKASTIHTIIEDENGQSQRLEINSCSLNGGTESDKMLQALKDLHPNVKISIMNPHLKLSKGGTNCIRVEKSELIKLDDSFVNDHCHVCGKEAKIRSCSACYMAKYCSKECQKIDWIEFGHKSVCKHLQMYHDFM